MKKIALIFLFDLILLMQASQTQAQTLIAVHNETGTSVYSNLDTAIVKAKAGDFIYLPGGSFKISKPIDKKLQFIGVGHNPDSCAATGISQVTGNFVLKSGCDYGLITGLKIYGEITFTVNATDPIVNNYLIERCNFGGISLATRSSNIQVNECVIHGSISGSSSKGLEVTKCIIDGGVGSGFIANTNFNNNIFLSAISYPTSGCYFKNNIFLSTGPTPAAGNTAFYQNNSFTSAVSSLYNCHNNIVGPATDLFKTKNKAGFDYDQDYHIPATSPAHLAGADGTDLGIYGTGNPWKEGSAPRNPHIITKTISTVDGKPNVNIKVAAQGN
jgi:hypothetical protein